MGSAVTVPSAETKPQGNTMAPLVVTDVKASSDAPYAKTMSTPAGTGNKKNKVRELMWVHKNHSATENRSPTHYNTV